MFNLGHDRSQHPVKFSSEKRQHPLRTKDMSTIISWASDLDGAAQGTLQYCSPCSELLLVPVAALEQPLPPLWENTEEASNLVKEITSQNQV